MELLRIALGLLLLLAAVAVRRRARRYAGWGWRAAYRVAGAALLVTALALILNGGYAYWFTHRPVPPPAREALFEGVTYIRDVRRTPRPLVIHVVMVDLSAPGVGFLVTPGESADGHELRSRTTSQFLEAYHVQLAVNGDFFSPWWSHSPWDYYPHVGDPVDVAGLASSRGDLYSEDVAGYPTFYMSEDNRAQFVSPLGRVYNAISGNFLFLVDGQNRASTLAYHNDLHPRTAVALDRTGRTLILIVIDGRQPNYSEGVTLAELAGILAEYGADTALNLDGGGSSELVVAGPSGLPLILNSPIDNNLVGRERPVANHLGVFARPSAGP